jgi:hypothetical protein
VEKVTITLPDKPSIAVLAFDNLSGDLNKSISVMALQMKLSPPSELSLQKENKPA